MRVETKIKYVVNHVYHADLQEGSTKDNPFETDAAFHSLPVSIKVKILYDLCDFRLDNEDVPLKLEVSSA